MAKIGTAHVEIKPVINDEALEQITKRVEEAVAEGVRRGMRAVPSYPTYPQWWVSATSDTTVATPVSVTVDGKDVHRAVVVENRKAQRRTGQNPLA